MGRITVKRNTSPYARGDFIPGCGVCRAPGWLQVYGVASVRCIGDPEQMRRDREAMATCARRRRLSSEERYDPVRDPRNWPDFER